jgi:hypothetical protein
MPVQPRRTSAKTSTKSGRRARTVAEKRPASARKAKILLDRVATDAEYWIARQAVRTLGIDPDSIPHIRPNSR